MLFVKYSDDSSAMQKTDADSPGALRAVFREEPWRFTFIRPALPWPDAKKTGQVLPCPVKLVLAPESGP